MYSLLNDRMQINIEINLSMVNPDQKYCQRMYFTFSKLHEILSV